MRDTDEQPSVGDKANRLKGENIVVYYDDDKWRYLKMNHYCPSPRKQCSHFLPENAEYLPCAPLLPQFPARGNQPFLLLRRLAPSRVYGNIGECVKICYDIIALFLNQLLFGARTLALFRALCCVPPAASPFPVYVDLGKQEENEMRGEPPYSGREAGDDPARRWIWEK